VLDGDPAPPRKGHSPYLLWRQSPISATAELLFYLFINLFIYLFIYLVIHHSTSR